MFANYARTHASPIHNDTWEINVDTRYFIFLSHFLIILYLTSRIPRIVSPTQIRTRCCELDWEVRPQLMHLTNALAAIWGTFVWGVACREVVELYGPMCARQARCGETTTAARRTASPSEPGSTEVTTLHASNRMKKKSISKIQEFHRIFFWWNTHLSEFLIHRKFVTYRNLKLSFNKVIEIKRVKKLVSLYSFF